MQSKLYVLYLRKRWDDWQSGSIGSNLDFYWIEEVVLFVCLNNRKYNIAYIFLDNKRPAMSKSVSNFRISCENSCDVNQNLVYHGSNFDFCLNPYRISPAWRRLLRNLWDEGMYFLTNNSIVITIFIKVEVDWRGRKTRNPKKFRQGGSHVFRNRQLYWGYNKGTVAIRFRFRPQHLTKL